MPGLAVVGGHTLLGIDYGGDAAQVVLQRHGISTPAHRVDHAANMRMLVDRGCDRVLAICSVGGLRPEYAVGTFVAPDDFIALGSAITVYDDFRGHTVPGFHHEWRARVIDAWLARAGKIAPLRVGGVYWQNPGPRFETPAEIRLMGRFADVVGMTMASECVVARELGLAYASICVVDNLANGVGERRLTIAEYEEGKRANRQRLIEALTAVVPELA